MCENDQPVTNLDMDVYEHDRNVDGMHVESGPSQKALGKRPQMPGADAHTRDGSPSQMDVDSGPCQQALGKRPEMDAHARREVALNLLFNGLN